MLSSGQTIALTVDRPAAGGPMIARADGQIVMVSGAIPGEVVDVRIERTGKGVAFGRVVAVREPSPDRRQPFADPLCGGCLYAHIAYERQLTIKSQVVADALARIGHLTWQSPIMVAPSPVEGYRMRARLHLRGGRMGFFREGSHAWCDARSTRQLLPGTCDVLERVAAAYRSGAVDAEVEVSENVSASERAIHVETNDGGVSLAKESTAAHVTDVLAIDGHDITLRRHGLAFFQGNRFLLRDLAAHVVAQIDLQATVLDLYAGAGLFAVAAAVARRARVTAVEGDRISAHDLAANRRRVDDALDAVHLPVEVFLGQRPETPRVLIVDPPRTGMSREALTGAIALGAPRVVYVSCDVATLARDLRRYVDAGYSVSRIDAFDLFPNTPHVETIVVLTR